MNDDCLCMEPSVSSAMAETPTTPRDLTDLVCMAYGPDTMPSGFAVLAEEWNHLLQQSRFNSFFLTHEWQTTWWEYLGKGDLWILAFRQPGNHELVGIASLFLVTAAEGPNAGKREFHLVGCIEVSDYLDIIIAKGWEDAVYRSLLTWLHGPHAPEWDVLELCNLPEESLTYQQLPALAEDAGLTAEVEQEDTAPQFHLPQRYEEYLQNQVDKKQRHEIRRKQRRAEREADVGLFLVGPEHLLAAEVDDFIALQQASRADKAEFMTPEMRRFFGGIAQRMLDAGYLRLFFLTIDGDKAASLFAFEYDRRFWLYNSGYDPDSHAQLSPGWVLLAYAIQYSIATGCAVFDFMQGDEEYKYRFGAQDYKVMRVVVRRSKLFTDLRQP